MGDLQTTCTQLPQTIPDLHKFVLVGREKLIAVRAEIRAITKLGLAHDVYLQKLSEAQDIADAVIDAEMRIGELISALPTSPGKRSDLDQPLSNAENKSKKQTLKEVWFLRNQVL